MKHHWLSVFLLQFMALETRAEQSFLFCYDPYPPYTIGNSGSPSGGLKVKLVNAVFNKIEGASAEVILLPWKQCQLQAKNGLVDGILPLFKNEERSEYLVFSDSTFDQTSAFWYKKSRFPEGIKWSNFGDLSHLKLGMLIGGFIDEEMETSFENSNGIHRGKSVKNLFELLLKERVDLVAIDLGVGHYIRKQQGWAEDLAPLEKTLGLKQSFFGLAKSSELSEMLDQINQAIRELDEEGALKAIQNSTEYEL